MRDSIIDDLDLKFRSIVLASTKNPLIIKVGQMLMAMLRETMRFSVTSPGGIEWTLDVHRQLLSAQRSRNEQNVKRAVLYSLRHNDLNHRS